MKLTGRDGVLRIYDSSFILHGAAPLDEFTPDIVKFDGASTYTNITSDVETDDANIASNFLTDNNDLVFIGSDSRFACVYYLKGGGADYAAASGALKMYYYDGTDFATAITDFNDGTASGGNCFAQDGYIDFKIPKDWAIGANAYNANLDSDKYYIALQTTTSPTTDPDADVLCPCDAQFFTLVFAQMDFSGPLGRPLSEEILMLNRNKMDAYAAYQEGPDNRLFEPMTISFSAFLDDTVNKDVLMTALECGNPSTAYWSGTGVTAKGTSKPDGSTTSPTFADATKKCVNLQTIWGTGRTGGYYLGLAYYEVWFNKEEVTVQEGDDAVILTANGLVYGAIERIYQFGVRY